MGYSISGGALILFIAGVAALSILMPVVIGGVGALFDAQSEHSKAVVDTKNTDFEIVSTEIDNSGEDDVLEVDVENTGSTVIDFSEVDLLIDGEFIPNSEWETVTTDGERGEPILLPNEIITIETTLDGEAEQVKVVVSHGLSETSEVN